MSMKCKNCNNLYNLTDITGEIIGRCCPKINDSVDIEIDRACNKCQGISNGDRIRNMSDEELADQILKIDQSEHIKFCQNKPECLECDVEITKEMCKQCLLDWLQKVVE